jgi:hypothetical protein
MFSEMNASRGSVLAILPPQLSDEERQALQQSANNLKAALEAREGKGLAATACAGKRFARMASSHAGPAANTGRTFAKLVVFFQVTSRTL